MDGQEQETLKSYEQKSLMWQWEQNSGFLPNAWDRRRALSLPPTPHSCEAGAEPQGEILARQLCFITWRICFKFTYEKKPPTY